MKRTLFLLCCAITSFAQSDPPHKALPGLWQNNQFGYQMTLLLNPDGSGEFDGEALIYAVATGKLSITIGSTTTLYAFTQTGNALTLSGGDLQGAVTFTRDGGETSAPSPRGQISASTSQSFNKTDVRLIGLWSGNGETIEFKPDGKVVYLGKTLNYQCSQGYLQLIAENGSATFSYTINGTQLNLSANGNQVQYNKVATELTAQRPAAVQGTTPSELVGQWCYLNMNANSQTSRCLTLHADGTYVYTGSASRSVNTESVYGGTASQEGDRGTWYVQGDRIYYNSPTQGQGSYRLEKRNHPKNTSDPMIVLDGEPYVTATLRPPWR